MKVSYRKLHSLQMKTDQKLSEFRSKFLTSSKIHDDYSYNDRPGTVTLDLREFDATTTSESIINGVVDNANTNLGHIMTLVSMVNEIRMMISTFNETPHIVDGDIQRTATVNQLVTDRAASKKMVNMMESLLASVDNTPRDVNSMVNKLEFARKQASKSSSEDRARNIEYSISISYITDMILDNITSTLAQHRRNIDDIDEQLVRINTTSMAELSPTLVDRLYNFEIM